MSDRITRTHMVIGATVQHRRSKQFATIKQVHRKDKIVEINPGPVPGGPCESVGCGGDPTRRVQVTFVDLTRYWRLPGPQLTIDEALA